MSPYAHPGMLLLAAAFFLFGEIGAQEGAEFHQFTDKKGQKVSALVLAVSPDNQQMKIRRDDGQEFDMVINLLSLDDQQYVKDWLKTKPSPVTARSDYRLNLVVTRQTGAVEKHTDDSLRLEGRSTLFRVVVRNLSRETLEGALLEYLMVWDDGAIIYQTETGRWTYTGPDEDEPSRVKQTGVMPLESLRFNGEVLIETPAVSMDQVFIGENNPYREDKMLGIKIRIRTKEDLVIHEADSGTGGISAMKWEDLAALPDPRVMD